MKVTLVHDYIKEYGGAERVLEALHEIFPNAPVFTSIYLPSFLGPHQERFKKWDIRTSWAQNLPFKQKLISPLRLISQMLFKSFDLSEYDVIISSATGAYFPNTVVKKKAKLICYCHTPPRYLYGYQTARKWKSNKVLHVVGEVMNYFLRMVDFNASKNVDQYIANSEEVQKRIEKFYRRDAKVVYPPVEIAKRKTQSEMRDRGYFLAGGRLARPKNIDLIIKTCIELGIPLKVFGKSFAGYGEELEELAKGKGQSAKSRIELLGEVSDEEKEELLAGAKAYIFSSVDEDFGILPVEAMALGTPVIAYKSGGVLETIIDKKTGIFYDELTINSLIGAIKKFEKLKIDEKDCREQAEKFSKEKFVREIEKLVKANKE